MTISMAYFTKRDKKIFYFLQKKCGLAKSRHENGGCGKGCMGWEKDVPLS